MFQSILLGLLQGFTEFLPISSSGHLILMHKILESGNSLSFDATLHFATVLAVIVYFRHDIFKIVNAVLRRLSRLPTNEKDLVTAYALAIGTIPAVCFGLLLEEYMSTIFRNPLLVASVLITGSILFGFAEWRYLKTPRESSITLMKGLKIGFFQCLALIPGMSRSGASIVGGMLMGLTRSEATRFSFLLAIPILGGAGAKKILELLTSNNNQIDLSLLLIAAITAFLAGLAAIHFMLSFVRRYSLWPFIWYRVILATIVIAIVILQT